MEHRILYLKINSRDATQFCQNEHAFLYVCCRPLCYKVIWSQVAEILVNELNSSYFVNARLFSWSIEFGIFGEGSQILTYQKLKNSAF